MPDAPGMMEFELKPRFWRSRNSMEAFSRCYVSFRYGRHCCKILKSLYFCNSSLFYTNLQHTNYLHISTSDAPRMTGFELKPRFSRSRNSMEAFARCYEFSLWPPLPKNLKIVISLQLLQLDWWSLNFSWGFQGQGIQWKRLRDATSRCRYGRHCRKILKSLYLCNYCS